MIGLMMRARRRDRACGPCYYDYRWRLAGQQGRLPPFEFAFENYTALGYGDPVPPDGAPEVGPITSLNGLLLIGWSVAIIFEVMRMAEVQVGRLNEREERTETYPFMPALPHRAGYGGIPAHSSLLARMPVYRQGRARRTHFPPARGEEWLSEAKPESRRYLTPSSPLACGDPSPTPKVVHARLDPAKHDGGEGKERMKKSERSRKPHAPYHRRFRPHRRGKRLRRAGARAGACRAGPRHHQPRHRPARLPHARAHRRGRDQGAARRPPRLHRRRPASCRCARRSPPTCTSARRRPVSPEEVDDRAGRQADHVHRRS